MIAAAELIAFLEDRGTGFFTGVPDSLLSAFSAALQDAPREKHLIAANEGAALALAAGYHLATGNVPLVYLQNSGLGNLVNPLTSLVDETVYSVPVLLLVGWRGQPGLADEPQHGKMGAVTIPMLEALNVPVFILGKESINNWKAVFAEAHAQAVAESRPVAIVVEKGVFKEAALPQQSDYALSSAEVIATIGTFIPKDGKVLASTGKIGRAFYQWNQLEAHPRASFLNVGAMGHTGSLAASLALHSGEEIWVLDGDGALLMHLGALALVGQLQLSKMVYIALNNGAHESVGRQPTLGFSIDFTAIARACGFVNARTITDADGLHAWLQQERNECQFVEIRINTKVPADLPRPKESPKESGINFKAGFHKK